MVIEFLENFKHERRIYDIHFPKRKIINISQMIPFYHELCKKMTQNLNSTPEGGSCNIIAYLRRLNKRLPITPKKELEKRGIDIRNIHLYTIHSDTTGLPVNSIYIAVSDSIHKSFLSLPFRMKLTKIKETDWNQFFYIEETEETLIDTSQIFDRPLPLKSMRKGLMEVMPSFTGYGNDAYIEDAILAGFIGTQPQLSTAGGIGALYPENKDIKNDLTRLTNAINSPDINIPLSHLGNFVYLDGNAETLNQFRIEAYKRRFRNISWNLSYNNNNSSGMALSDFKYDAPFLLGTTPIDIKRNMDFRISLAEYAIRSGNINENIYGILLKTAFEELEKWIDLDGKDIVYSILSQESIPIYVYNIGSFYSKFGFDAKHLSDSIKNWIEGNAMAFGEKLKNSKTTFGSLSGKMTLAEDVIKRADNRIFLLLAQSDRTMEGLIEKVMSHLNYSPKKAEETIKELRDKGLLIERTNKKFYWWFESRIGL